MRYTIKRELFNAVLSAQAVGDVRYYLNGFFLRADEPEIVATNGHMLCMAPVEVAPDQISIGEALENGADIPKHHNMRGWIFGGITKPLSKSAEYVEIDTDAQEDLRLRVYGAKYKGPKFLALHIIDGTYPDYLRVLANNAQGEAVHEIGLDPEYLYRPIKWAGVKEGVGLRFNTATRVIQVFYPPEGPLADLHTTLMPRRL